MPHRACGPILLAMAAAVPGCTSLEGWMSRPPDLVVVSAKPPQALAACIAQHWAAQVREVETASRADGLTVAFSNRFAGIDARVTVTATDSGSQAVYEAPARLAPGWLKEGVTACR